MTIKTPLRHLHSLRSRIIISVLVMVLPAALLMFSAYNSIRGSNDSLTQIIDSPLDELLKIQKAQSKILKTELPFHLYLNRGESADREAFIRLSVDIDLLLEKIAKQEGLTEQDLGIITLAQNEWHEAKTLGESLLTTTNIPSASVLTAKVDQFGRHLERCASLLDEVNLKALEKIKHLRFAAQENEWKSIAMLSLVFGLGLLLAILAALSLGQSVIEPIKRLEKTVNLFGKGETSTRINLKSNSELDGLATAFNSMAERFEHIKNELNYLSVHDNLTGLYDRTKLQEEVSSEIVRSKRYDRSFSLLLMNIDNFKEVNRVYGRLVGDSVLCSVANKITATVRPTDISSRYDGDEFAVILSETDSRGAAETTQRLIESIEDNPINIGDGKLLNISVTIVTATYPADADTDIGLFAVTDNSLVNLKLEKKNTFNGKIDEKRA